MNIKSFQGGFDKNFSYLIWCEKTKLAAVVDPAVSIEPILKVVDEHNLTINKILISHTHHDHIHYLNDYLNLYPKIKVFASENAFLSNADNFTKLAHNDIINIGEHLLIALFTPGHYKDSICYWSKDKDIIFTGDTMFVGRSGRTISSGSNISDLYNSIYNIILKLPAKTIVYPGHHYGFSKTITLKENIKISNFFKCESLDEFILVMESFEKNRRK